jgi:hypothetical protein
MLDSIAKVLDIMKVPIRLIFGLCVAAAVFLYSPDFFVAKLGLLEYRDKYRAYFGVLVLILVAMVIANVVTWPLDMWNNYALLRVRQKNLRILTAEEKQILDGFISNKTQSRYLSVQSGVVKGLVYKEIIYRTSNISDPMHGFAAFAHNIQPWAWDYLNEHPELLSRGIDELKGG